MSLRYFPITAHWRPIPARCSHLHKFHTSVSRRSDQSSILATLQPELKTALRTKDKLRLTVLRSLIAEITNASKTSRPIENDTQFLSLLLKQIKASSAALQEFETARREDLVEKEREHVGVLEEWANKIPKASEEEVDTTIRAVIDNLGAKANIGIVTGKTLGELKGKPVDVEMVKRQVAEILGAR